jgi:AraC-like DNA-binding protein
MKLSSKQHGFYTVPFPADQQCLTITGTGTAMCINTEATVRRDGWRAYQLMWTFQGEGHGQADGKNFIARLNSLTLMPKNALHQYGRRSSESPWKYRWIEFAGEMADRLVQMLGLLQRPSVPECTAAEPLIEEIVTLFHARGNSALHEATAILMQILVIMESVRKNLSAETSSARRIERSVRQFFLEHLHEEIDMNDVADALAITSNHLNRVFKRVNGIPPYRYLRDLRMNRAKTLLHEETFNISEIGQAVGYPNLPHFSRVFKQAIGLSPSVFRQRTLQR